MNYKNVFSGPYMLGLTVGTFLLSKEIFVAHGIPHIIGFLAGAYFLKVKVGDSFGKWYNKYFDVSKYSSIFYILFSIFYFQSKV